MKKAPSYLVACKSGDIYVLATHRSFRTREAAELYLASVAVSREPIIILVD
jgi:hypothetical protein